MSDASRPISFDAHSFILRGKREFLIGGEFHYFRTPNDLWEDSLIKMKRSGANLVTTYIPWNWHEPVEGRQRWTGDCDLNRFLQLCTQHGLFIIVKPGPYCCAEWDFGGHPDWLLGKKIPLRVLNDKYLEYVRAWYQKVAEIINPHLITKGGNIICIQVENEYDHLMEFGEEKISKEDAITYFTRLGKMMEDFGIDIPKFANEAGFLRGKGNIIDTRTYYPNIPLFLFWMYQHNYFDGKILAAKKGQPNCPTMILELQVGWFGQFGRPPYVAELHLTESVSKSVVALGASLLNYYMYVGGTTFPFWGCRGNTWDILPRGCGTTTSFDFGGSPIREWGELMPGRMDFIRALSRFTQDYKDLVLMSDDSDDLTVTSGGEGVIVVGPGQSEPDTAIRSDTENFRLIAKKLGNQYLACVRNLGAETKVVDIGRTDTGQAVIRKLEVRPRETHLLPIGVQVPGTDITIEHSTSELLFAEQVAEHVVFGLYGKPGRPGETVFAVPASDVKVLSGDAKLSGEASAKLEYVHKGIQAVQVRNHRLLILDQDLAGKIEEIENGLVITDAYYVRDIRQQGSAVTLKTSMRNASKNTFHVFNSRGLSAAKVAGEPVEFVNDPATGAASFTYRNAKQHPVKLEWLGDWKLMPDTAEAAPDYDDSGWKELASPVSLEEAGLFQHGYIWYRAAFDLPQDAENAEIVYPGNDCDRQHVFVNGQRLWDGITTEQTMGFRHAMKPGRNVLAVLYENFFHSKSHPHEGAIRKYSGILKPVVIKGKTKLGAPFTKEIGAFKVREQLAGNLHGYVNFGHNDNDWQTVPAGHKYVMDERLGTVVWMRRKFRYQCKKDWEAAVRLTIPEGRERCLLYVNGHPLGQYESIGPQHEFYVPSSFLKRDNVLAVVLEGPRAFLAQPVLDTFYAAKEIDVEITLA